MVNVVGLFWFLTANLLGLDSVVTPLLLAAMVTLTVVTSLQYLWRVRLLVATCRPSRKAPAAPWGRGTARRRSGLSKESGQHAG